MLNTFQGQKVLRLRNIFMTVIKWNVLMGITVAKLLQKNVPGHNISKAITQKKTRTKFINYKRSITDFISPTEMFYISWAIMLIKSLYQLIRVFTLVGSAVWSLFCEYNLWAQISIWVQLKWRCNHGWFAVEFIIQITAMSKLFKWIAQLFRLHVESVQKLSFRIRKG